MTAARARVALRRHSGLRRGPGAAAGFDQRVRTA